jgi:hypothetical protein
MVINLILNQTELTEQYNAVARTKPTEKKMKESSFGNMAAE